MTLIIFHSHDWGQQVFHFKPMLWGKKMTKQKIFFSSCFFYWFSNEFCEMLIHVLGLLVQKSFDLWCSKKMTPLAFTSVTTVKSLQCGEKKSVLTSGWWVVSHVNPAFCRLAQILCPDVRRPWLGAFASKGRQQGCRMRVLTVHWFSSLVHLPWVPRAAIDPEATLVTLPFFSLDFVPCVYMCVCLYVCVCVGYVTENIILIWNLQIFSYMNLFISVTKNKNV